MKDVYVVAEDEVTSAIALRLIKEYAPHLRVKRLMPVRGGQIKNQISNYNLLSLADPVILLSDQDTEDCAPQAKSKLLGGLIQNPDFLINIAVDEAEAWLYADTVGLSSYLKVPIDRMPVASMQKMGGMRARIEIDVPIKTSLHLTSVLIHESSDEVLVRRIESTDGRCKGKEYNRGICPFIAAQWDPERARRFSYSLDSTVRRIVALDAKYA